MTKQDSVMNRSTRKPRSSEPDFHGAALIDERGREIPITEEMVQRACAALERSGNYSRIVHRDR